MVIHHYHNDKATQRATQHNRIVLEKVEKDETMAENDRTNCPLTMDFSVKRLPTQHGFLCETVVQEMRHISVENFEPTRDFSSKRLFKNG